MARPHQTPSLQGPDPTCPSSASMPFLAPHRSIMVHRQPRTTLLPFPSFNLPRLHFRDSRMAQHRHIMHPTLDTHHLAPYPPSSEDSASITNTRHRLNTYNKHFRCIPSTSRPLPSIHYRPRSCHKITPSNPCKHYYLHPTQQHTKGVSNAVNLLPTTPYHSKQTPRT